MTTNQGTTSSKGLILICIAFMVCGVRMWMKALEAINTGDLIHDLSHTHSYTGFEAAAGGTICIVGGLVGMWAVLRKSN
jgi:hypothetical protein